MNQDSKIVCLGGGVGTSSVLKGLKYTGAQFTIIMSMADDGGSSGRLRTAYNIMPPGDIVNGIAALIPDDQKEMASLLLYRFPGNNTSEKAIDGQKLGNLIMLAEIQRTGDFYKAIEVTKRMFGVNAVFLPATDERTHLSATTVDGRRIHSETTLDLALYAEPHGLKKVFIRPAKPKVNPAVAKSLLEADIIISGPGDLYTNQLPVLIVPEVRDALLKSKARKLFVLNVANKPFETNGFTLADFIEAITEHLGAFPFDTVIVNDNISSPIPKKYKYKYITYSKDYVKDKSYRLIEDDVVNSEFPLYHDPKKLAEAIQKAV
jgi:uncharacterized cofD-like protein